MDALDRLASEVGSRLLERGELLATAESCTGGGVAHALTAISGSSAWFERGFVTYSNDAKTEMLGVDPALIESRGAVSETIAVAMAAGALRHSRAQWALAITGVAGPTGGSPEKPVGTVCFAWAGPEAFAECETCHFAGDRAAIRRASVEHALRGLLQRLPPLLA